MTTLPTAARWSRYRHPNGRILKVDAAVDHEVLDQLNALPEIYIYSTCVGHPQESQRGRAARRRQPAALGYYLRHSLVPQLALPFLDDP
jgi:hypothetical protein